MSQSLGLSIGVANLVAARAGTAPVTRSSVVTLFEHRPTEVGLPEENPNLTAPGLVLRGFVERVGDRAPLVAADGTKYLGAALTVEAIEAMARTVGYGTPVSIAVPAYWSDEQFAALRDEFFAQSDLARGGVAPMLVSDATAAVAALRGTPGFPPTASSRCATSVPAAPPSRCWTPMPALRPSPRPCGTPTSPATRSISSSSITCWPPMSAPPSWAAARGWDRRPACWRPAGAPRNNCRPPR